MCEKLEQRELLAADVWDHSAARALRDAAERGPDVVYYDYVVDGQLHGGVVDLESAVTANSDVSSAFAAPSAPPNVQTVVNNGPSNNRIDFVIVGDGYTSGELATYRNHVDNFLPGLLGFEIFGDYASFINVHRIDVISNESGVDNDPIQGVQRDTALDMGYWCGGTERLLCVDVDKVDAMAAYAPDVDQVLAVANSSKYGGAGYPSRNIGTLAGDNILALDIAIHELGHSFGDLADEYEYGGPLVYTGPELTEANVSIQTAAQIQTSQTKWHLWLDEPNVDAFLGGRYSEQGVYRPTDNSMMRNLGRPFEQVNTEQLIVSAYKTVQPIDAATAPGDYAYPYTFFVDPVDPVSHALDVQWFIDSQPVVGQTGLTFDPQSAALASGDHVVSVTVVDNTPKVRDEALRARWMTEQRSWTIKVPVDVTIGGAPVDYLENSGPVPVLFDVTVNDAVRAHYGGSRLQFLWGNAAEADDSLLISTADNSIQLINGQVFSGSTLLGNWSAIPNGYQIDLTDAVTPVELEKLLHAIAFQHSSDAPSAVARIIHVAMQGDVVFPNGFGRVVNVIPVNDSPSVTDVELPNIPEDVSRPSGQRINTLFATSFSDVDRGASMSGLVVVGNPQIATEGSWQFSTDSGATWLEIGAVNDAGQSLVIPAAAILGFLPIPDFHGQPQPLRVRVVDNSYTGGFANSAAATRTYLDPIHRGVDQAASKSTADVRVAVINSNDAPEATQSRIEIDLQQDEAIDRVLPSTLFFDVDSPVLNWSLIPVGSQPFPTWLKFDPATRRLTGTPANRDVGTYQLILRASDQDLAFAAIPLVISVANVNDAPEGLRLVGKSVRENSVDQLIGQLFASDPDEGDQLTWSVSDPRFFVRQGQLFTSSGFDYETEQTVPLTLTITDDGTPAKSASLSLHITILDANEFVPDLVGGERFIADRSAAGALVHTLQAPDGDRLQLVRYRLVGGDMEAFQLDTISGELRLAKPTDIQRQSFYKLFAQAYDNGVPVNSRDVQFDVLVTPVNLAGPVVPSPQTFFVPENSGVALLGKLEASDVDATPLMFTMQSGDIPADWIAIDPLTGAMRATAQAKFNYESKTSYSAVVEVKEMEEPFRSVLADIHIEVQDVNDAPNTISLTDSSVPVDRAGITLGAIQVVDDDPSDAYSFQVTDERFQVVDGVLSLKPQVHFTSSQVGAVDVAVLVTDAHDASSSAWLTLKLDLFANAPWQNYRNPLDVDRDGHVVPADALKIINGLNSAEGSGPLPAIRSYEDLNLADWDTNGDNVLSPIDALIVINWLNSKAASAEAESFAAATLVREVNAGVEFGFERIDWGAAYVDLELMKRRTNRD